MTGSINVGERWEGTPLPAITRLTLALYCGGSGDHNPLHVDIDAARAAGFDDVIAHGMLPMAYLGRFVTGLFPQSSLQEFDVRFVGMTHVGDVLSCAAECVAMDPQSRTATLEVSIRDADDVVKATGSAMLRVE